jgi:TolB-like protein
MTPSTVRAHTWPPAVQGLRDPGDRFQRVSDAVAALETLDRATRVAVFQPFRRARRVVLAGVARAALCRIRVYRGRGRAQGTARVTVVSLAMLPFKVLTGSQEIGYLSVGIPDTIGSQIAVKSIRVRSALASGKEDDEPQAVGRRLGVGYVLTGTIQKDGERMGITPQLVRVEDGVVIWTDAYKVPSTDH